MYATIVHNALCAAGLWSRYFLVMFKGDINPSMPKKPPRVHIHNKVVVPYTVEEMTKRNKTYKIKKAVWDKTMKVTHQMIN